MNVLFFLGNGFDINLGLPTGYQSFYAYYLRQESVTENIALLKQHLSKYRYETWADLELGLGQYTSNVNTIEELEEIYFDIGDQLRLYLHNVSSNFEVSLSLSRAIHRGVCNPHDFLPDGMKRDLASFLGRNAKRIDIISFNYTDTFETVFDFERKIHSLPTPIDPTNTLNSIRHIHMRLSNQDFIMGVNDDSQIKNKSLLNDACRRLLIKPYINQQLQNLVDEECMAMIDQADLICMFGLSLGLTDLMWWEAVGRRMSQSTSRLILFTYDDSSVTRNSRIIGKMQEARSMLLKRFGIENAPEELIKRIYIGYNTDLFKV